MRKSDGIDWELKCDSYFSLFSLDQACSKKPDFVCYRTLWYYGTGFKQDSIYYLQFNLCIQDLLHGEPLPLLSFPTGLIIALASLCGASPAMTQRLFILRETLVPIKTACFLQHICSLLEFYVIILPEVLPATSRELAVLSFNWILIYTEYNELNMSDVLIYLKLYDPCQFLDSYDPEGLHLLKGK